MEEQIKHDSEFINKSINYYQKYYNSLPDDNVGKHKLKNYKEDIISKRDDFLININTQISIINSDDIPRVKKRIEELNDNLKKSKKELEDVSLKLLDIDFVEYINALNRIKVNIFEVEKQIEVENIQLEDLEREIENYKELSKILTR